MARGFYARRIIGSGEGIHWPDVDEDISIRGMLQGIPAKEPKRRPDCAFWPDQVLKDAVACLAVMAAVLFLILKPRLFGLGEPGAELGAPADASEPYSAARPEWYFLFLFQFLKYFPGGTEVWGAIVIPAFGSEVVAIDLDPPDPPYPQPQPLRSKTIETWPLGPTGPRVLASVRDFSQPKEAA